MLNKTFEWNAFLGGEPDLEGKADMAEMAG